MITLSTSGNSVIFTFQDNPHYLQNGTIEVPKNSLMLVTDSSNMATFKKSASNDIFISALYSELGMTKTELEDWYKTNMVGSTGGGGGGGDVTSGDVQTMIDESISGKVDTSAITNFFGAVNYDSNTKRINFYNESTTGQVLAYVDATDFIKDGMVDNVEIKTISGASYLAITFNSDSGKEEIDIPIAEIFDPSNYYTKTEVDNEIDSATSGKADSTAVTQEISAAVSGKVDSSSLATVATSGSYNDLIDKPTIPTVPTSNTAFTNDAGYITADALSATVATSAVTTAVTSASTDAQIPTAKAVFDAIPTGGSNNVIEVTQAEYDALVSAGTLDLTAMYVISDATAIDISQYYTSAQTESAINQATSGKVDTTTYTAYTAATDTALGNKLDSSAYTPVTIDQTLNSGSTNAVANSAITNVINEVEEVTAAALNALNDKFDGMKLKRISQSDYNALVSAGTVDANTLYIITQ